MTSNGIHTSYMTPNNRDSARHACFWPLHQGSRGHAAQQLQAQSLRTQGPFLECSGVAENVGKSLLLQSSSFNEVFTQ